MCYTLSGVLLSLITTIIFKKMKQKLKTFYLNSQQLNIKYQQPTTEFIQDIIK